MKKVHIIALPKVHFAFISHYYEHEHVSVQMSALKFPHFPESFEMGCK